MQSGEERSQSVAWLSAKTAIGSLYSSAVGVIVD